MSARSARRVGHRVGGGYSRARCHGARYSARRRRRRSSSKMCDGPCMQRHAPPQRHETTAVGPKCMQGRRLLGQALARDDALMLDDPLCASRLPIVRIDPVPDVLSCRALDLTEGCGNQPGSSQIVGDS